MCTQICPENLVCAEDLVPSHAVPLYDSLGENAVEYTINHSKTGVCFIHENKVKFLLKALPKLKTLKAVVVWGNPSKDVIDNISKQVSLLSSSCQLILMFPARLRSIYQSSHDGGMHQPA